MRRPRHHESFDPVIISHQVPRPRDHFREPDPVVEPEPVFEPEPSFEPESAPVAFQESAPGNSSHAAEVVSLDAMRSAPPSYQAEDLDVPAFLRKRSEVM